MATLLTTIRGEVLFRRFACVASVLMLLCQAGCDSSAPKKIPVEKTLPNRIPTATTHIDATTPVDLPQSIASATTLTDSGRFADAEIILRRLLIESPDNPPAIFLMARCKAGTGDLAAAASMLELIPVTHPEAGLPALGTAADWLIQVGRLDEAEQKLRTILRHQDRFMFAHRRLAQLLNSQGRRAEAMTHMRALAKFGVATPSELYGMNSFSDPFIHSDASKTIDFAMSDLGAAKLEWFDGDLLEAQSKALGLLRKTPPSAAEAAFAGRVLTILQDDDSFAGWIERLPPGVDQQPEYWFALGDWHQRHGQDQVAVRCFAEAIELDDTDRFS